ncbi:Mdm33 family-domain-containing protein [Roridomyces roridus]|uniref:Sensitive to high expression protein 9, mitochondrial n=1 Tax=Roridomyces roridus TaxID=1738132 RepID=A0AAD7FXB0_9AGAR|nr:Mdm33 family-domain-containing protein [Roridomyces roridus]
MFPLRSALHRPLVVRRFSPSLRSLSRTTPPESDSKEEPTELKDRLRQWTDQTALTVRTRADEFTSTTKAALSKLGFHLNKATGYEEIETLKRRVVEQELRINEARNTAQQAKATYDAAVLQRSNSQREVNDLLQRKSNWSQADIARFTTLVPQDHLFEQQETHARTAVHDAEEAVEREFSELMRTILARYHEEQVWSDKIRSASTYGSLAALGLNLLVFVTAILFVEPWKRRRLAMTFEKKIEEMGAEYRAIVEENVQEIGRKIEAQTQLLADSSRETVVVEPIAPPVEEDLLHRLWKKSQDREVGATVASTAAVAVAVGWLLRTWLGT